jgi:hypothetical protein
MLTNKKRILSIALALVLVFSAFGGAALALPGDPAASYTQVPLASAPGVPGQFTVDLSIDTPAISIGGSYFDVNSIPVILGNASIEEPQVYYVVDVLVAAEQQYSQLEFFEYGTTPLSTRSSYMDNMSITSGGTTYNFASDYGYSYYNGWMFRVNDKFTMLNAADYPAGWDPTTDGPVGAAINQAYVENGVTVDLYFANADQTTTATQYERFESASYSGSTLTAQITTSVAYNDLSNNYWWTVTNFAPLASTTVSVYIDGNTANTYTLTTDSSGNISITGLTLPAGTHSLTLVPQFISGEVIPSATSGYIEFTI